MLLNCKNNKFTYVMHCLEMDTKHHIHVDLYSDFSEVFFWASFFFWRTVSFSVNEATHEYMYVLSIIRHNLSRGMSVCQGSEHDPHSCYTRDPKNGVGHQHLNEEKKQQQKCEIQLRYFILSPRYMHSIITITL